MGTMLQLPSFPRHGILLNPSPTTSPYNQSVSLPGTPHLISSLSSLSSSASSSSPHNSEADNYFLTTSSPARQTSSTVPRNGTTTASTSGTSTLASRSTKRSSLSAPHTRKIRFAPLPEPRRDEQDLPDVFLDDEAETITALPLSSTLETPRANATQVSGRSNSLLFSGASGAPESHPDTPTPTTSTTIIPPPASSSTWSHVVASNVASSTSGSERYDSDTDLMTPLSPSAALSSSSIDRYPYPQSCPESPIGRRVDLPKDSRKWSTKKLFKPLLGPLAKKDITPEDVLTLGLNQLVRSSTRDSDGASSGATTPLRNRSRERSDTASGGFDKDVHFGAPLSRSSSDNTSGKKQSKKKSLLSSLMGSDSSSSGEGSLWRTQSATEDMRRTKSRESTISNEDLKRTRSYSASGPAGRPAPRKQLKMLNGRVYGAKRNPNVNLFASARSEENEFVEWGYGGMGSVKSAASVGNTKYSRVQGSAALGSSDEAGWSKGSRGRQPSNEDDDGSGLAWARRRKEERERAKKDAAEKVAVKSTSGEQVADKDVVMEEHLQEEPHTDMADPDPPTALDVKESPTTKAQEAEEMEETSSPIAISEVSADHVTTAVKPACDAVAG
ncbi:hypothetical protein BC835DRAFT_660117 [Cytidiella melzeri]|nr:hypothetical protein BC835DRAFT_660117 [Cytidiella melzeri]